MDFSFNFGNQHDSVHNIIGPDGELYSNLNLNDPVKKLISVFDSCVTNKSSDHMKVFLRVRPIPANVESTICIESETSITTNAPDTSKRAQYTKTEARNYIFNRIFGPDSSQDELYTHAALPLLRRFLEGENCVLFAYGMTNSGKTYTMQGTPAFPGILPRLLSSVLEIVRTDSTADWKLSLSMLEIYQEKIYDLLSSKREKLSIRDGNGKVEVCKLSCHAVDTVEACVDLMNLASSRRSKSNTLLNTGSSRSHAVYTITLSRSSLIGEGSYVASYQLVDLAGAERGNRTKANVLQQKEANNINVSLMQLWRCLQGMKKKIAEGNSAGDNIIPFRESKLTHLLMPILNRAGLDGVGMIACVNPQVADYDETVSILGNASLASKIKEIADFGRTATTQQSTTETISAGTGTMTTTTTDSHPQYSQPTISRMINMEELKEYKENNKKPSTNQPTNVPAVGSKRRRGDDEKKNFGQLVGGAATKLMKDSIICTVKDAVLNKKKSILKAIGEESVAISMMPILIGSKIEGSNSTLDDIEQILNELDSLRKENEELRSTQLCRETEIRMEVSEEMSHRSHHLLEQIKTLQNQLVELEQSDVRKNGLDNITRSCKKAMKRQQDTANLEVATDLHEAEQEIERIKQRYENEVNALKGIITRLEQEVIQLRKPVSSIASTYVTESVVDVVSSGSGNPTSASLSTNSTTAATQFSQRMQRDARFKKNATNLASNESVMKSELSPIRSPLIEIQMSNQMNIIPLVSNTSEGVVVKSRLNSPSKGSLHTKSNVIANKIEQLRTSNRSPNGHDTVHDENQMEIGVGSSRSSNSLKLTHQNLINPYSTRLRSQIART